VRYGIAVMADAQAIEPPELEFDHLNEWGEHLIAGVRRFAYHPHQVERGHANPASQPDIMKGSTT
jgi:hypothetical protein